MTFIQSRINIDAMSWRCIDVDATLTQRCVPAEYALLDMANMCAPY